MRTTLLHSTTGISDRNDYVVWAQPSSLAEDLEFLTTESVGAAQGFARTKRGWQVGRREVGQVGFAEINMFIYVPLMFPPVTAFCSGFADPRHSSTLFDSAKPPNGMILPRGVQRSCIKPWQFVSGDAKQMCLGAFMAARLNM